MKKGIIAFVLFVSILGAGLYGWKGEQRKDGKQSLAIHMDETSIYGTIERDRKNQIVLKEDKKQKEVDQTGTILETFTDLWNQGNYNELYSYINQAWLKEKDMIFTKEDMIKQLKEYQTTVGGTSFHMVVQDVTRLTNYQLVRVKLIGSEIQNDNLIYDEKRAKVVHFCLFSEQDKVLFLPFEAEEKAAAEYYGAKSRKENEVLKQIQEKF